MIVLTKELNVSLIFSLFVEVSIIILWYRWCGNESLEVLFLQRFCNSKNCGAKKQRLFDIIASVEHASKIFCIIKVWYSLPSHDIKENEIFWYTFAEISAERSAAVSISEGSKFWYIAAADLPIEISTNVYQKISNSFFSFMS